MTSSRGEGGAHNSNYSVRQSQLRGMLYSKWWDKKGRWKVALGVLGTHVLASTIHLMFLLVVSGVNLNKCFET